MIAPSQATTMAHGTLPLLYTFHFYLFGLIAVASALFFVTRRSPVAAALWLVNTMFCLAALFVLLDAQFIGALQVIVYAGAIMVVFLFVIMLLNLGQSPPADIRGIGWKLAAGAVALAIVADVLAVKGEDAADAHAAHRVHGESGRDDRRRGADRRSAVQRLPVGVRDHQHPPSGGDRRRRRPGTPARRGPCSLKRSFSRPSCSRSASSAC
jgi:NADH:ubiquinone oxidoreductase subunit 6 (subunit J)